MATKVKEIVSNPNGDRRACSMCSPRADRVPMDRLWRWSLAHPGEPPFRQPASCPATSDRHQPAPAPGFHVNSNVDGDAKTV